ncbi:MAG: hypothetical protein U0N38_02415, partial [Acutalibacteraceae bacterium]
MMPVNFTHYLRYLPYQNILSSTAFLQRFGIFFLFEKENACKRKANCARKKASKHRLKASLFAPC